MIRKAILLTISLFLVFWFVGAYFVKERLLHTLRGTENDNVKIYYEHADISGFPTYWQVNLKNPTISVIDHVGEYKINTEKASFRFSLNLGSGIINLGNKLTFWNIGKESSQEVLQSDDRNEVLKGDVDATAATAEVSGSDPDHIIGANLAINNALEKYDIVALSDLIVSVNNNENIFDLFRNRNRSFWTKLDAIDFDQDQLSILQDKSEIYKLSGLKIVLNKDDNFADSEQGKVSRKFDIIVKGKYDSDLNYFQIKSSKIEADLSYILNEYESGVQKDRPDLFLIFSKLHLGFDQAFLEMTGRLELFKSKTAQGILRLKMKDYTSLIEKLIPENFIVSKKYIHQLITKAVVSTDGSKMITDQVSLDIEFSENNFQIGKLSFSKE